MRLAVSDTTEIFQRNKIFIRKLTLHSFEEKSADEQRALVNDERHCFSRTRREIYTFIWSNFFVLVAALEEIVNCESVLCAFHSDLLFSLWRLRNDTETQEVLKFIIFMTNNEVQNKKSFHQN